MISYINVEKPFLIEKCQAYNRGSVSIAFHQHIHAEISVITLLP